jgi:hypothetical protein
MGIVEKTGIYQHIVITPPGAQGSNPHGDKDFSDSLTLRGRGSGRRRRFAAWRADWGGGLAGVWFAHAGVTGKD